MSCSRTDCSWTAWMGHINCTGILSRVCRTCREQQLRILPPGDVERPGPTQRDDDLVWNGTREEGE